MKKMSRLFFVPTDCSCTDSDAVLYTHKKASIVQLLLLSSHCVLTVALFVITTTAATTTTTLLRINQYTQLQCFCATANAHHKPQQYAI